MRAAKIQWSPARNRPLPPEATENDTTTPCSSTTCVAAPEGTVIRPVEPGRSRSIELDAGAARTTPRLVPAPHPQVPGRRVGGVRGPQVGRDRAA